MSNRVSRRRFLAQSAAIGATALAAPAILRALDTNGRINLGFIAAGGRARANLAEMTKQGGVDVNIVALCDVNGQNLERGADSHPKARLYKDFRKLLDESKDIDAVVVSTCEHTHAYAAVPALQMGKAVYCEKPLSRDVQECRAMRDAAKKAKVATQMGTQNHANPNYHRVVELIHSEAIGPDPHPEIAPASMTAIYEYGPRGEMPACRMTWYQGTHKPQIWKDKGIPQYANGVLFIGTKGRMLLADYSKNVLLPEAEFKDFRPPEKFIMDGPTQQQEWLLAIKNGTPTGSPFNDYAGLLTEANHLGNVAFRTGQKIVWDTANMRVTNTRAADRYISREPRAGWRLS